MERIELKYRPSNQIVHEKTIQESVMLSKLQEEQQSKDEFNNFVVKKKNLLSQKLEGETKESHPIGAASMTQTEWKRLLDKVDKTIEEVKKEQKLKKQIEYKKALEKVEREKRRREEKRLEEECKQEREEKELKEKELLEQRILALLKENQ